MNTIIIEPVFLKKHRSLFPVFLGCLLAVLMLTASAIELPDIGDSSGTVISPEKERQLGAAFFRNLQGHGAILEDLETQEYLQSLGKELVLNSDAANKDFTFFPVAAIDINAFAVPGGFVGVNAGLILNTETESELAGVLAHEISHVTQRHMARSFERAEKLSVPMAVALIGSLILGVANPNAGLAAMTAVTAGNAQGQINFTRANEKEADRVGMALLSRSGFDPEGMPSFFERLQVANRLTDPKFLPEFLRTHPVTTSRIADAENRLAQYPPHAHKYSDAYKLTKARIKVIAAKSPGQAEKIFKTAIDEGDLGDEEDATHYGYALALMGVDKYQNARDELNQLLKKDANNISYLLAMANLETRAENYRKGLRIYKHLNSLYPGYRPVVMDYTKALLQYGQIKQAKALLLDYGIQHGTDRIYYELLGEAEGRDGSKFEAHMALAEYHYLNGETDLAHNQLKIAERSGHLDNYHKQRLQARLEEIEKEMEEEKELKK